MFGLFQYFRTAKFILYSLTVVLYSIKTETGRTHDEESWDDMQQGPQVRLEPGSTAARTRPLYMGRLLHQLSYLWDAQV